MQVEHYDLVIIGAGSGDTLVNDALKGWRVAIVEADRMGGTCLNRGCIPSKMLIYTADVARGVRDAQRYGVHAQWRGADWPAIRDRVFGRIDPEHESAVEDFRRRGIDVYLGEARFVGPQVLRVGEYELHAERFVVAVGSRPSVPTLPGLDEVDFVTSDNVMRLDTLPASMIIIGGGYIAAEMSHVFGTLGARVTIIAPEPYLLDRHDRDVRARFSELSAQRFEVHLNTTIERVEATSTGARVHLVTPDGPQAVEAEVLLVATGRTPNSDRLNVAAAGLEVDEHGHLVKDEFYQSSVTGIWTLGDVTNHSQLKHMANAEARLVLHNLTHPEALRRFPFSIVPSAVFADPQVASVGATEQELEAQGRAYVRGLSPYSEAAYGWAMEDVTSFVKVLADPQTHLLVGAHVMGPQASILIQPFIQAMCLETPADRVAHDVLYVHPALSEVVEHALLNLSWP